MAREVVSWCDRCLERGEQTPASEVRFGFGDQWWSADLCLTDQAELLDPVRKLIADFAARAEKPTAVQAATPTRARMSDPDWGPTLPADPVAIARLQVTLDQRRSGIRNGRRPTEDGQQLPCIFCGVTLRQGLNTPHLRIHGYQNMTEATNGYCPWCGIKTGLLGGHLQGSHAEKVLSTPLMIVKELLEAHLAGAPFDRLEDMRSRAYAVEPLAYVLEVYRNA